MRFIADLHVHSHHSRATSKEMNIVSLAKWAQLKGTSVLATGDFTHPRWFNELQEKLEPAEDSPGLFKLKAEYEKEITPLVFERCRLPMRFILSAEISTIYKKNGRVRKLHNLIYAPSFETAAKLNSALQKIGNLHSDGRPILGLDAKALLEKMLEISDEMMFVLAHIWTPYFSVFGSMSGFDSLREAFDELTPHIVALETGLSSDPAMNWRISEIDNIPLISNSDAHSPMKLGREANVFETDLSYFAIRKALQTNDLKAFKETLEFFPEEGKYHLDGHRLCGTRMEPQETLKNNGLCPVCGKKVTVGVLSRVETLADRPVGGKPARARPFRSIIPLPEILSEIVGTAPSSKKVQTLYMKLLSELGSEFTILLETPLADIEKHGSSLLAEGLRKMRETRVHVTGGYDGEFGVIKVFNEKERKMMEEKMEENQMALF